MKKHSSIYMKTNNHLPSILIYSSEYWPFYKIIKKILRNKGYKVEVYIYPQEKNKLKYFSEIYNLFKIGYKKYNVIHAYFGTAGLIANIQRKIPVITTYCGSDLLGVTDDDYNYNFTKSFLFRFASLLAYNFSVNTTTLSKKLEDELPNNKKNTIIPLGVDTDHFKSVPSEDARKILGWSIDDIYVLFPSEKNRSVKRYYLAEKLISSIDINYKINLISLDEPNMYDKLPLIMSASNFLVFVSKHEGSPNVIREALSCNLPIFSFDVGDVKEQIKDVKNCFCVDQDDLVSLKKIVSKFLTDNAFSRSDGREKIINYTWVNYVDSITKLININVR